MLIHAEQPRAEQPRAEQPRAERPRAGSAPAARRAATYAGATVAVIATTLLARIAIGMLFGADFMESYGIVVSRQWSLSYFDHPPLTWWLIALATRLFGTDTAVVARLPFILAFAGAAWLMFRITARLYSARAGFYAACAFSFAPLFGIYDGTLAQTDNLMEVFILASLGCIIGPLFDAATPRASHWASWIGGGLCCGLALASKYTAVLLLPGLVVFFATQADARRWLGRPQPYVAVLAAAVPLLPVLVWNAQHDWASFLYQGGRAGGGDGLHPVRALRWILVQPLSLLPWILVPLVVALARGLAAGPRDARAWLLCCMAAVPLVFFPLAMLWSAHPLRGYHWGSVGYLPMLPLVGAALDRLAARRAAAARTWLLLTAGSYCAVLLVIGTHALTGWIGAVAPGKAFAAQDPVLLEFYDWTDLPAALKARGIDPDRTFVTATRWEECAKAAYALRDGYRLLCLAADNIHFSYLADPQAFAGQDAVVVDRYASLAYVRTALQGHFASVEEAPSLPLAYRGRHMADLKVFIAKAFDGTSVAGAAPGKWQQ